jgi:hypothetical protein
MSAFVIKYLDTKISICEYEDDNFIRLKNRGEESWKFEDSSFWNWFKEKIEYEDEKLCFVVLCDDKFEIDNSIKISDKHGLSQKQMEDILYDEDLSKFDILQFPNQYKTNDIKSSIQNRKQIIKKEYEKENQLEDLNSQKDTLNENLIYEQKKQKKTDDNKLLLLKRLKSIKKEYTTTLNNKKDDYIPLIANSAKEFTLKAVKFIVVYASSNDEKDASKQAHTKDEFILINNKEKYEESKFTGSLGAFDFLSKNAFGHSLIKEKVSIKEKISIKLDEKISLTVNENIDEKDILSQFNIFFKNNFTSLNTLYNQFLEDIDIINKNYTDKIAKISSQTNKYEYKKLVDEDMFFGNALHLNSNTNIIPIKISKDQEKLSSSREILRGIPAFSELILNLEEEQKVSYKITIFPDKIIKLIKENIAIVDDRLIKAQNEIQTTIEQHIPKETNLLKEEVSSQTIKINSIQDEIDALNKQINILS